MNTFTFFEIQFEKRMLFCLKKAAKLVLSHCAIMLNAR